jgi:hypothetical protein
MVENEAAAHALADQLRTIGIDARVGGAGVHWQVDVGPVASRAVRVHCFWYERAISGLALGMNAANSRSRLHGARLPYEGAEYLVILQDGGGRVADGRTRKVADVVACVRAWLASVPLGELVRAVPFVDAKPRAMRAITARIDPRLRWEIGDEPVCELWIYGQDRSCRISAVDDTVTCSFLIRQQQVALGRTLSDVLGAVSAWLVSLVPLRAFASAVPGVEIERHAEVLESDPARWHWLHLRDRIADPHDALAPLRNVIRELAASPIATTFYSYSSLNRLCFSASSHYPWVDEGLPRVTPLDDGMYWVDQTRCDFRRAVALIDAVLGASPVRPFFGSAPHHELPLLSECLARQGSVLRPTLVQRGAWYDLLVTDATGERQCKVSHRHVSFIETKARLDASWQELDHAVDAIRRFCEGGASLEEIAADPRAKKISRHGSSS